MRLAADLRILETRSSFYDGETMPWKTKDKILSSSTTPSSPLPKKEIYIHGYGHSPWLVPSLGEVPRYRITITPLPLTLFLV
jgi:hypothetical protein